MRKLEEERNAARQMRKDSGLSINEIARRLNVAKSSVSTRVRDVDLSNTQLAELYSLKISGGQKGRKLGAKINHDKAKELREEYQKRGRLKAKENNLLFAQGCMLYWAEGSKSRNTVALANTDVNMLKFFIRFLRDCFNIKNEDIYLYVRAYTNNGLTAEEIQLFWLNLLELDETTKFTIRFDMDKRQSSGRRTNVHPNGICTIYVGNTEIIQQIFGAIQEYGQFKCEKWLE